LLGEVTRRIAREEGVSTVARRYAAEGIVPTPPVEPTVPVVEVVPDAPVEDSELDTLVDHALDSALDGLTDESGSEFAVELEGLPDELELILRRRLVSAA
jgi:hypothetical protein